jgi:hypothetical protein
MFYFWL